MLLPVLRRPSLAVLTALGLVWSAAPGARAADSDRPVLRAYQPPYFTADLSVTVDSTSRARVRVTISVPYSELSWQKDGTGYTGGAAFMVELDPDRGPRRLYGDSWDKRVKVVDHPISVRQAFWAPFKRVSRMVAEQINKMAMARSKAVV